MGGLGRMEFRRGSEMSEEKREGNRQIRCLFDLFSLSDLMSDLMLRHHM